MWMLFFKHSKFFFLITWVWIKVIVQLQKMFILLYFQQYNYYSTLYILKCVAINNLKFNFQILGYYETKAAWCII